MLNWRSIGAAFLSAGRYHHHIGMNTWNSLNGKKHNPSEVGLENFTIIIADKLTLNTLRSLTQDLSKPRKQLKTEKNQIVLSDPDDIPLLLESE